MAGEFEPNDSRNVTGTGSSEDGRWTNQQGQPPRTDGQPQQGQDRQNQTGGQGQGASYAEQGQGGQSGQYEQQGMNDPRDRQSQQFDSTSGQSGGSWGSDSSFKDQIREHMTVVGPDGQQVGTVDSIDGERIKLTRNDSPDGQHHYIACSTIEGIEGGQVRLAESPDWQSGETSRGM